VGAGAVLAGNEAAPGTAVRQAADYGGAARPGVLGAVLGSFPQAFRFAAEHLSPLVCLALCFLAPFFWRAAGRPEAFRAPLPGLAILFVVSFIQAFFLGGNGWVGFVMHMLASGVMVLLASLLYRRKPSLPWLAAGLGCGAAARTLMMIPMNLIFTVHFFGVPHDVVVSLLLPGIIPMNLIISVVNCLLAGLLFKALRPVLEKFRSRWMRA